MIEKYIQKYKQYQFLFEELVKRDFKKRYVRSWLGVLWSILSPLCQLLVMRLVFTRFFGRTTPHYTIYLFSGTIIFSFFSEATQGGMTSLADNASIFTKINVPKYLFLFAKNTQSLLNFLLILLVYFFFCIIDGVTFTWNMLALIFPIVCLLVFNLGVGLVLSALYVFFKDTKYLYSIVIQMLHYFSAIFYNVNSFPPQTQKLFLLNPVYLYIRYFRMVVLEAQIPTPSYHLLMLGEAVLIFFFGIFIYKKYNLRFMFYV